MKASIPLAQPREGKRDEIQTFVPNVPGTSVPLVADGLRDLQQLLGHLLLALGFRDSFRRYYRANGCWENHGGGDSDCPLPDAFQGGIPGERSYGPLYDPRGHRNNPLVHSDTRHHRFDEPRYGYHRQPGGYCYHPFTGVDVVDPVEKDLRPTGCRGPRYRIPGRLT